VGIPNPFELITEEVANVSGSVILLQSQLCCCRLQNRGVVRCSKIWFWPTGDEDKNEGWMMLCERMEESK